MFRSRTARHAPIEDGDEVIFRTSCRREGYASIGFGDCAGTILPAINY
jgi:fumarylacetoacetase